ncbi:hypothetical protein A3D05_03345 [Candidatus Gottesmanbacteria bacterium RIFCSPHIGHO2_02_FULL_40_24]|uniref:NGG1p interacting factor NIF3 n=1 Tax=Candidatus Gottesmanbacteria bacterium RIFCSPHIGHO2_01_FULL_40_15 TaxID=1798376 RepID=A0A1F5Z1I4_9BACT|nr:MAG: hypothetical protein A2777_02470 [Candidatus Gottesmanbacteria bacterium RIFCSPHIGHO2_01_FULL_40_15]OGG17869.1 MAG: hypothetical protein A3D05_03345 [Candidatus Gottesmanbacteria bacterium RIFCSPHIGHO2_02_FULL_40_24]OGG21737.1 MAG: hypothetical protein A3B48_03495 [Candidatus Gottesmanbacteria bacterium RIFCSPLOWO2_01_FULL_40_10]OGG24711.1 MAG: hypothetical protein A3E42_01525 [Candidatus Gottesmanbacteria bacterium RIFCSPHIGHO2_12_FULL_40_13]
MYKFFVFCPRDEKIVEQIIHTASQAGAGTVGKYTHCAFITEGHGTWYPLPGAEPTIGKVRELSKEEEVRIEMECPKEKMQKVFEAVRKVHPYDKISIDAFSIERFE